MAKHVLGFSSSGCSIVGACLLTLACAKDPPAPYNVGDKVPDPDPKKPAGTVTQVASESDELGKHYQLVTIDYPPEWSCPAGATNPDDNPSATALPPRDSALTTKTCADLAALRRPALKADSRQALNSLRVSTLWQKCVGRSETRCMDLHGNEVSMSLCYPSYSGQGSGGAYGGSSRGAASSSYSSPSSAAGGAGGATSSASGATDYSTTNTQVVSVDEADFVKNDANTIYVLAADGLHVIDAWPAAETRQVAKLTLPGEPRRLFLEKNRLVVYTRMQSSTGGGAGSSNPSDQGCTYGYDCRFQSEGGHTMALVFDVSDPVAPKELVRYETSGAFVASRRVGPTVYTVVHDTGAPQIPGLSYDLTATSYRDFQTQYQARIKANEALIDETPETYFLPWARQTLAGTTTAVTSGCDRALSADQAVGVNFTSVLAFDLDKLEPMTRTVVATRPGYVYASAQALYLAVDQTAEQDYSSYSYYYGNRAENSVVHKFALSGTDTRYLGSAALPGHILNQFAMDEDAGILRVASTRGWVPDSSVVSFVTTYKEGDGKLVQQGQIGGIAPTEDIRSVRFDGTRAFVVTFKKTDPLFVFDLSDTANPKMMGELKIPGFSTYMHPLDRDHLLAIGFNADDQGSYAFFNGIQIQIFDVSVLSNPTLMWKTSIGTRGSNSEALTNHLAFNYFPPKKMLALPLAICEGGGNGTYGDKLTFAGLMAFDVSLEKGISEHGRLPFVDPAQATGQCNQWWTDSKSLVKRSIFMDDWIYGLTDTQLRVAALANMSTPLQTVSLSGK